MARCNPSKGDTEATLMPMAFRLAGFFKRIVWPTMPAGWLAVPNTNEAIFCFHATTLVFSTVFPGACNNGDALIMQLFSDKTLNPFVPYPSSPAISFC